MADVEAAQPAPGSLYLVSTPIGNLSDLSPRALEILAGVSVVYAEDTRRSLKLIRHFDLGTPLVSLHQHNERERVEEVLAALAEGSDCALVTDAGTPSVSDPGAVLVRAVAEAGYAVVPIPGPSAVLAALAASGFGADEFAFLGFPPRSGGKRAEWLEKCGSLDMTVVAFEAPGRVGKLLADLAAAGLGDVSACVCRELTKLHEEVRRGTVAALADYYGEAEVRGEVTIVLERPATGGHGAADGGAGEDAETRAAELRALASRLAREGATTREITDALREHGVARNAAYEMALDAEDERGAVEGERE